MIDSAADERPVQRFLAEHPEILSASLLEGHTRCVRSQVRLGSEYVADFILASVSSIGIEWVLVELESPRTEMFISTGEYAKKTRTALWQIGQWRAWIVQNLSYASHTEPHGTGLLGIDPGARGLVLVGRRDETGDDSNAWQRKQTRARELVDVHSYDWLLDKAYDAAS